MSVALREVLAGWGQPDLANLAKLLDLKEPVVVDRIIRELKWLYYSKARAHGEAFAISVWQRLSRAERKEYDDIDALREPPSYDLLVREACKHMHAAEEGATLPELELYLPLAVVVSALAAMTSRQRLKFFETSIDPATLGDRAAIPGHNVSGPATTFALLAAAQASGFGTYLAATTALGFLTHAVGLTLPFAVYTGLSSTVAFLIGPIGWLSVGLWGAWKATGPNWKKIVPALVYIIARNSRESAR